MNLVGCSEIRVDLHEEVAEIELNLSEIGQWSFMLRVEQYRFRVHDFRFSHHWLGHAEE
jgi:hypothetical protein